MLVKLIRRLGTAAVLVGLPLFAGRAAAQFVWTGTTSGNWSDVTKWQGGTAPTAPGTTTTTLSFGDGTYTATNDVSNPYTLNALTFTNTGTGANGVTIAGGTLNFAGTNATITKGTGDATISAPITLGASLTTAGGAGTLTLTGGVNDSGGGFNVIKTGTGPLVFGGTATSSFNQLSVQNGAASITGGTLNLTQPDPGTRLPGLQLGAASGQTASFTASGGATVNVTENVFVGDAVGSTGTLTVTGAGTTLANTAGGASGRFAIGNSGNGTLNVLAGGVVNAAFMLTNRNAGTSATITVDGPGSVLNTIVTGSGGSGNLQIASNNAVSGNSTGTLNVTNGGVVNVGTTLFVAQATGNTGIINVSGKGSAINVLAGNIQLASAVGAHSTMTVSGGATATASGTYFIGNASGTAGAAGDGTLTVTGSGSTVTAGGGLQAGTTAGSVGTVNVLAGATATITGNVFIGAAGAGTSGFPDAKGTLNVDGLGSSFTTAASLIVSGGGTPGGTGFLNVTNGGTVNVNNLTLTQNDAGTSTATVSAGTVVVNSQLLVGAGAAGGVGGTATLNVQNGGKVVVGGNTFASAATVTGTMNLTGFGSSLTVFGQTQIGGSGGVAGTAVATLNANAGSTGTFNGSLFVYGGSTVNVNTGVLGSFTVAGLNDGGTGSAGTVNVGTGSALTLATTVGNALFDGVIAGSGDVTKTGPGTQFLFGANNYTGSTNVNGGVLSFGAANNLGTGAITFNGGTLQWANNGVLNTTDITAGGRAVTLNSGGGTFDTNFNSITLSGVIGGVGGLTVTGGGVLALAGTNTYLGPTNIQNGVVVVTDDANLGSATTGINGVPNTVTSTAAGTLVFTGTTPITTSRLYNMGGGTIISDVGQTVTFNGSIVSGAILDGPGGFATGTNGAAFVNVSSTASAAVTSNSANDQFFHYTLKGPMTVAAGVNSAGTSTVVNEHDFTISGSGSLTVGSTSRIIVSDFQSSGVLTLVPGVTGQATRLTNNGTTPLSFNGGSRTFIATPQTAGQNLALLDLHGQNAIVAGGLFVNNGFVGDSAGTHKSVIADFGSLVKGAGVYADPVITQNGGKFQAGNSPGSVTFGSFILGSGGVDNYVFAIDNAAGTAGPKPDAAGLVSGWGLVNSTKLADGTGKATAGSFAFTADPAHKATVSLETLVDPTMVGTDVAGPMSNFDPNKAYTWSAFTWTGSYNGPTDVAALDAATGFDTREFLNPVAGNFGWSFDPSGHGLNLTYSPSAVPEPGTLALVGAAALAGLRLRRKKK